MIKVFLTQIVAASIAFSIVGAGMFGILQYQELKSEIQRALPASEWFEARVVVPDHIEGDNPRINYYRNIKRYQRGEWYARVESVAAENIICQGSGNGLYTETDGFELYPNPDKMTLNYYMGKPCNLKPGKYRIRTSWLMRDEAGLTKAPKNISQPFTIKPFGSNGNLGK